MTENTPPQNEPQPQQPQPGQQGQAWWQRQAPGTPPYGTGQPADTAYQPMPGGVPEQQRARERRGLTKPLVITGIVAALVGGGLGVGGSALLSDNSATPVLSSQPQSASNVSAKPGSVSYAADVALKSTVDIKTASQQGGSEGTGIVLTQDGYVLTNNHVVSGASSGGQIQVTTSDGKKHTAQVKGAAPSYDLAVIKLDDVSGLTPAKIGESSTLKAGQQVAAVGSPYGFTDSVTSGIVSALSRTVTASGDNGELVVYNALQTDAAINSGNSGGPLVNMDGQVVGVNSAKFAGGGEGEQSQQEGGGAQGIGYSIPIDTAKRVANELMQTGKANKPMLGVTGRVGTSSSASGGNGAQLAEVTSGGPAEQAGIKQGDVVTKIDDMPIGSYADLMAQVLKHQPGQEVPVTVKHTDGGEQTVKVRLGSQTDTQQTTVGPQQENPFGGGGSGGGSGGGFGGGSGGSGGFGGGSGGGFGVP